MQYGGYNQYQQQQQHQNSPIQFGNARGMFQQPTYQQQTPVYQQQPQAHQQQPPSMYDQASFSSTQEQPRPKEERVLQPFITQSSGANSIQPMHPETASNLVSLTPKTDKREENRAVPPPASKPASSGGETAKVLTYSTETKKIEVVEKPVFSYASMVSQGRSDVRRKPAERTGSFKPAESHPRQAAPDFAFKSSDASIANLSNAQAQVLQNIQQRGDSFYSKTSFFDDISSDAKESKGGDDSRLKNERSWNMETFGIAAPPRAYNNHPGGSSHGRGSYRGSSSRGSYRGGRGGAHS